MSAGVVKCPFSYFMFLSTAYLVTRQHRKSQQLNASDDEKSTLPPCEVVFVLGGPGAGKGTQCHLLAERMKGWSHLSAGDLLRAEREAGGELGDMINAKIASGQLVPSTITVQLLENGMVKAYKESGTTKFLIDGFPRSDENLKAWDDRMKSHNLKFVLNFECPEEVLVGRLLDRGQNSGRSDDNIDVIRKRFHTFQKESMPIVQYYERIGVTVHKIEGDQTVEKVYAKVSSLFSD